MIDEKEKTRQDSTESIQRRVAGADLQRDIIPGQDVVEKTNWVLRAIAFIGDIFLKVYDFFKKR